MVNAHIPPPGDGPPPDRRGGLYLVAGVLVAIALAAGVLFYSSPPGERTEQAAQPDRTLERTINPAPDEPRMPTIPRETAPRQTPLQPANPPPRE